MGGPLVFHRILFFLLNCLLAYKIGKRLLSEFQKTDLTSITYEFDWNDVNLKEPPRLQSPAAERMRLNELLAVKTYDCKRKLQYGDEYEKYVLCGEFGPFKSAASVSGDKSATGELEKQIAADNLILFTPEGCSIVDKLAGDVELNYFTELEEWHHWHTWDLEQVLKGRRVDVAKFELYTTHFESHDQPDVIRKLVPMMKAKQLLLTIKPDDTEKIVWKWYTLLYWLFFDQGYAIVGAIPNGVCGSKPRRCQYRVSLAKIPEEEMKSAPVFGMSSPLEEKRRLMKFMQEINGDCPEFEDSGSFPPILMGDYLSKGPTVIVRHSSTGFNRLPRALEMGEKVFLVSPDPPRDSKGIAHLPWFVSSSSSDNKQWTFKTLADVLSTVGGEIALLILDLDGGEWELLPQLLQISKHVRQISIRGRIFPEENENYRLFYWQLYRLTRGGFEITAGRVTEPSYSIVLQRK